MPKNPLSAVMELIKAQIGSRGAQRLERAADEVPNLDKLYDPEALQVAFTGPAALSTTLSPREFLGLAAPFGPHSVLHEIRMLQGEDPRYNVVRDLMATGQPKFHSIPVLSFGKHDMADPYPVVTGHEGRHRSLAMREAGITNPLTVLRVPSDTLRAAGLAKGPMDPGEWSENIAKFLSGDRILQEGTHRASASDPEMARLLSNRVTLNPFSQGGLARCKDVPA
jgi:hypothetical protein